MSVQIITALIITSISGVAGLAIMLFVKVNDRLRSLETNFAAIDTKVSPLWKQVEAKIANELHHDDPRYAEMDHLLENLLALRLSTEERHRLKELLTQRVVDPSVPVEEQKSAKLMIAVMDKVLIEAAGLGDKLANVIVAILFWYAAHSHY